ncbi:Hypothetical protein PFR_JS12-1_875 [Propionibacterium freudenreichii]|uniref:hypothetical protein n=1 Tax=Propionibacterium freudenreichii TaxID=1744 RepID=UPI000BC33270|nr:hypothetical protein [Propionibacterium freudenreichii]SBN95257.1 Hypothetical protein PFR_JS12-2_873 [Propionibacterium freudenreichii]SCC96843.1 Hypothetical protein PFR_JS12-1_875 [Propionibacterium freudenreichii]
MATNEPDIAAKLLEHLDAKYAAGQLSPAEHEARRTRLLADIQRGAYNRPSVSTIVGHFAVGIILLALCVGIAGAGGGGLVAGLMVIGGFVLIGMGAGRLVKRIRLKI